MAITKAIVPVAGWGTRRLPITKVIEKSMLPVGDRPLIDYSVQELAKAGVRDIYIVVSDAEHSQVRAFYEENVVLRDYLVERGKEDKLPKIETLPAGVTLHYVTQPLEKYGTAVPVSEVVKQFGINEQVLIFMGDDFIWNPDGDSAADSLLAAVQDDSESAILGVEIDPTEVAKYGVLSANGDILTEVVEKPTVEEAPSNLINVSKYIMSGPLLEKVVQYVESHDFGPLDQEYLITDPISEYINEGGIMRVAPTTGKFLDGGSVEGWLEANQTVLA